MRRLGLLNDRVREDHSFYGIAANARHVDLPYPGIFVLDAAGLITHKQFHESYRVRDTGVGTLTQLLGWTPQQGAEAATAIEGVRVCAWLDSPTYAWFQRLQLTVELVVAAGLHVYGNPAEEGYVPISVEVAPIAGLEIGPADWPAPRRLAIDGLAERFWVHEGTIRGSIPLVFSAAPGAGDQVVRVTVTFQVCSDSSCLPPASVTFALPVGETPLVDRALPTAKS